jgi:hypothetical protein
MTRSIRGDIPSLERGNDDEIGVERHGSTQRILRWDGVNPVCRAEYRSFRREQPEGVRHGCRTLPEVQDVPSGNPRRKRGTEEISGIRVAFSLDTFFWRRKRKYRGCRSANRH